MQKINNHFCAKNCEFHSCSPLCSTLTGKQYPCWGRSHVSKVSSGIDVKWDSLLRSVFDHKMCFSHMDGWKRLTHWIKRISQIYAINQADSLIKTCTILVLGTVNHKNICESGTACVPQTEIRGTCWLLWVSYFYSCCQVSFTNSSAALKSQGVLPALLITFWDYRKSSMWCRGVGVVLS